MALHKYFLVVVTSYKYTYFNPFILCPLERDAARHPHPCGANKWTSETNID
jgi:hypothetical protein